jgi:hypothetical protein
MLSKDNTKTITLICLIQWDSIFSLSSYLLYVREGYKPLIVLTLTLVIKSSFYEKVSSSDLISPSCDVLKMSTNLGHVYLETC